MKITKTQLKQIIKEEITKALSEDERPPGGGLGGRKGMRNPTDEEKIVAAAFKILGDVRALMPEKLAAKIAEELNLDPQQVEDALNSDRVLKMLSDNNIGLDDMYQFVKTKERKGPYQHTPSAMDLTDYTQFRGNPNMPDLREAIKEELEEALSDEEMRAYIEKDLGVKIMSPEDIERSKKDLARRRAAAAERRKKQAAELERRRKAGEFDVPLDREKLRGMPRPSN